MEVKLPTDKYYIAFRDNVFQHHVILHNSFLNEGAHTFIFKYTTPPIQNKDNVKLEAYSHTIIGEFDSIFEAQLWQKQKRYERVKSLIKGTKSILNDEVSEVSANYAYFTSVIESLQGESKALNYWFNKKAEVYPEYFI